MLDADDALFFCSRFARSRLATILSRRDRAIVDGNWGKVVGFSGFSGEGCTLCAAGERISELPESTQLPDELPALPFGEFDRLPAEKSYKGERVKTRVVIENVLHICQTTPTCGELDV